MWQHKAALFCSADGVFQVVAIFTGLGAGFVRGSANILGGAGQIGGASQGRGSESVSVNAATGNLLINQQDEFLVGRGLDIGVSRTYNSQVDVGDGDNSDQWQQSSYRRVFDVVGNANASGSTVKRQGADGSVVTYAYNVSSGRYVSTDGDGAHDTLTYDGSVWTWKDGSSRVGETYSSYGSNNWRITQAQDRENSAANLVTYTYVGDKLEQITTADGSFIKYIWSGNNITDVRAKYTNLANSSLVTQTRTRYAYDGYNRLIQVTVDLSPEDNAIADGKTYVTTYTYHGASKQVATISQTDGSSLAVSYDGSGRVSTMTQTVAAGDSRTTSIAYGANYTNITAPDGQVTRMDYDTARQLTKITAPPAAAGATAQAVLFAYDTSGNVTSVTDSLAKVTSFTYDANGNQLSATDPNGNVVTRTYDANNNRLTETSTGSSASGAAVSLTTRYAYDGYNQLRYIVSPEGRVTEYYYDGYGQMYWQVEYPQTAYNVSGLASNVSISEGALNTWRSGFDNKYSKIVYSYFDARGNVTQVNRYGRAGSTWGYGDTSEGASYSYYTYDHAGRLLSRNNNGEIAETFVYDGLNRVIGSTDLAGGTTSIVFNDAATQTVVTLANGQVTTSIYNKAGDLVSVTEASDWSPSGTSTFKYDKLGRIRMATDANGYNAYYVYDKAGRKTADVSHHGELIEYRYDAANRIIGTLQYYYAPAASQVATLANPDNNLTVDNLHAPADTGHWTWNVYDSKGRLVEEITGDGWVKTYSYDQSDRLIATRQYVNVISVSGFSTAAPTTAILPTAHAGDRVTRYFYDRDGRVVGTLNAEGYLAENVYDKAGQLIEEIGYAQQTGSGYWASGTFDQLKSTISAAYATNRRVRNVYDGQGLLRYSVNSQGVATRLEYNTAGRLTQTIIIAGAISTTDFSYDNVKALANAVANGTNDRLSSVAYNTRGQIALSTDAGGLTTYFTYDNMGQVIKTVAGDRATRNWYTQKGEVRFSVDAEGFVTEHNYDALGQVTNTIRYQTATNFADGTSIGAVSTAIAADYSAGRYQKVAFGYDSLGQLVDAYDANNVRTNVWFRQRGEYAYVQQAYGTPDQSDREYYGYNDAGLVTWKGEAWGETAARGDEQRATTYNYDGLGNLASVVDPRGVVTTYTYDRLGRVTKLTDALGGETLYQYDAFGNQTAVRDARGYWTYNSYDNLGRLTQTTDASGVATTSSYNNFGELVSVTRAGATTSFQYDKMGRVTRSTDALGFFETYTYDLYGNRTSKAAKSATGSAVSGGTTTYTYDRRGLLLTEVLPMASYNNAGALVSSTVTNNFEYDAYGNRTKMIEAFGLSEARTTQYVYDKNNRLIETIGQTFLGQTPHEYITYDARGNVTSTTNAAGGRTVFFYDDLNRKTFEINAVGTYTKYTYDKNGNVTEIRVFENTGYGVPADGGSEEEAPGFPSGPSGNSRQTTFVYDSLNRMTSSSVHGAKTGYWNGSSWVADTSAITTQYQYDANGNVVKLTDGYGNATYSYYDALGRKTHQVDQENYLTLWSYNAEGNVTWEYRYTNKVSAAPQVGVLPNVNTTSEDRLTSFSYDLAGNRTSETRYYVLVHNGGGAHTTAHSTIYYSYNGLGQVTRKTEATGDFVDYSYDAAGRLTVESRKAFTDSTGASVTPTVDYYYNGINNLSRTRQRGSGDSAERVTMYGYDGDKLRWIADAEGQYRYYWYDQGGRQTYDYYTRLKSDGSQDTSYNGNLTSYDVMGRVIYKWQADYTGNTWTTKGPVTQLTYNAYGDVTGTLVGGVLQQQNQYDYAGRLTGTTSGDGIWKYFGYDKNGNQTVAITSTGGGLGGSFDAALGAIGAENVNATYTAYDKRNQATTVFEEGRRFSAGGALQNLTTTRNYNAFGEVLGETNAAGSTINYSYNTMGRMIRSESPAVEIVGENGVAQTVRPTEDYYYDASGRLIATRDANGTYTGQTKNANTGNLTILNLLTGTGYGGSQAQIVSEVHADGGVKQTKYDIHGDVRIMVDEIGRQSTRTYDRLGRMVQSANGAGLVDYYSYDIIGQQLKHWNNYLGQYDAETTDYDIQGRVISQRSFGSDTTTISYSWDSSIGATGILGFGGWLQTTYMANGLYAQEKTDFFGRVTWKRDLGGHTTDYSYDIAGRMASSSTNGMLVSFGWFNSGLQGSVTIGTPGAGQTNTSWSRDVATYSYDVTGNRLTEYMVRENGYYTPGHYEYYGDPWDPYGYYYEQWVEESYYTSSFAIKNQSATYDALGRMKTWAEAGTGNAPASSTATSYDANGNVRRTLANYYMLDANGSASTATTRDYWFRYDSMNRVVTNQGVLENGQIVRGVGGYYGVATGQDIFYNVAGERTATATTQAYFDGYGGYTAYEVRENYFYDAAGRLASTYQATGASVYGGYGSTPAVPAASGTGTLRSAFYYDLMGRMSSQTDYDTNGYTAIYNRTAYYNSKGQLTSDYAWTKKTDNKTYASSNSYYYTDYNNYQYMLGSVGWMQSTSTVNGGSSVTSRTVNSYQWWDSAVQSAIQHKPNISQSTTYNTSFYLNNFGQLTGAYIADGKARSVSFTLDELGQIIRRDETRPYNAPAGQTGSPHEVWYRFGGRQLGYTGNNGTSEVTYEASINERRTVAPTSPGTFRNGQLYGASYADFAQNYDPINSYYQGSAGGSYRVQQGDTLQGIAQSIYGDASLWYKIAEANGLSAGTGLIEGQTLILPTGVTKSKFNAGTSKAYNPGEAIGDLSPTMAQPPKKPKCGVFGMILIAVIAIAVTVVTAGAALSAAGLVSGGVFGAAGGVATVLGGGLIGAAGIAGGLAIGAGAAMVGSIVSQGIGVATGIQEKFSWKGVAMAGIGSIVSAGIGQIAGGGGWLAAGARAAAGSAITQGIGVATGLQDKFDWAGVAAAGVGSAVGHLAGDLFKAESIVDNNSIGNYAANLAKGAASAIANAVTRSALTGESFSDSFRAAIPDVVAQTLADILFHGVKGKASATITADEPGSVAVAAENSTDPAIQVGAANAQGAGNQAVTQSVTTTGDETEEAINYDDPDDIAAKAPFVGGSHDDAFVHDEDWKEGLQPNLIEQAERGLVRFIEGGPAQRRETLGARWKRLSPDERLKDPELRNAELARRDAARRISTEDPSVRRMFGHGMSDQISGAVLHNLENFSIPNSLDRGVKFGEVSSKRSGLSILYNEVKHADHVALLVRQETALNYFTSRGWKKHQAAGIVANLTLESRLDPGIGQTGGPAYGIAQWEAPRRADFKAWKGREIFGTDLTTQLAFVNYELTQSKVYAKAGQAIQATTTAYDAGYVTSLQYERPRDKVNQPVQRGNEATRIYNLFYPPKRK